MARTPPSTLLRRPPRGHLEKVWQCPKVYLKTSHESATWESGAARDNFQGAPVEVPPLSHPFSSFCLPNISPNFLLGTSFPHPVVHLGEIVQGVLLTFKEAGEILEVFSSPLAYPWGGL